MCPNDPLLVEYFELVEQECTWAHVEFDDESVADYFDRMVDAGLQPSQFARIWIHTHPGDSPHPSGTDEVVFRDKFGECDWSIMFILAEGGEYYARLQIKEPAAAFDLSVQIDYSADFVGSDRQAWDLEYDENVFGKYIPPYIPPKPLAKPLSDRHRLAQQALDDAEFGPFDAAISGDQDSESCYSRLEAEADAMLDGYDPEIHEGLLDEDVAGLARLQREANNGNGDFT